MNSLRTRVALFAAAVLSSLLLAGQPAPAQDSAKLAAAVQQVMDRPEFAHANFGVEFYDLASGKVLYSVNSQKLFTPASTTKILTEGTLLARLGKDYRFHTAIYRTGPLDNKGRLKGDLILVASGDPNLSNRIQPDGSLSFQDEDHSYGGPAVAGDPLAVIKALARQVHDKGVRRIDGRVLIDTSLFPDGPREGGTDVVMSSIMVNDNVIDLVAAAGAKVGEPLALTISPQTAYIRFLNKTTTTAAGTDPVFHDPEFAAFPDGSVTVALNGSLPLGIAPQPLCIGVPSPTLFAEYVLREALAANGVELKTAVVTTQPDFAPLAHFYTAENLVAEHISLPLAEEVKVTLKVSQNLHAGMGPYLLGALVANDRANSLQKGFEVERAFLTEAKLDLSGASQGDGAGGDWADLFSPDFMCHYLAYWTTRPDYDVFFRALPILGKDGTLAKIQVNNPGAGHVFAKTGTFGSNDRLNARQMLNGKGLAGYVVTKSGRKLAFAAYVNHVALPADPESAQAVAGQALGEIAAAAYDAGF
ncbi:MAG TPA: D-alanyl-D-alanine carboxypeptidase/D-alanyl-D-alanine-endopeptidase [Dongiaceae bacterium]|nr:D-alanyl-D-alanine carboxypeptidase/D-alanyl-D-alanine-endopeptidase [Dongiaceae bacterium]